jgi:methylenetetrahydrofolate reductase (NADPH)
MSLCFIINVSLVYFYLFDFIYSEGVVDKGKLVALCMRLGITESLRYLHKNTASVMALLAPGGYDPTTLLGDIAPSAKGLNITGMHCFTFNSTTNTVKWVEAMLGKGNKEAGNE